MKKIDKELLLELDLGALVSIVNEFCYYNHYENSIYYNDENGYREAFFQEDSGLAMQEIARSIHYGDYNYHDEFFTLDGYDNIKTFSRVEDIDYLYDLDEIAEFVNEHTRLFQDIIDFSDDDDESDDE